MFSYTNRKGDAYYVHETTTPKGRRRFTMKRCSEGALEQLPEGMEVAENVNGLVSIRRIRKRKILPLEERLVTQLLGKHDRQDHRVEIKGRDIIIHEPDRGAAEIEEIVTRLDPLAMFGPLSAKAEQEMARKLGPDVVESYRSQARDQIRQTLRQATRYYPVLRLRLTDAEKRHFAVAPRSPFDDDEWCELPGDLPLADACNRYIPRLGNEDTLELL
jgi:hypothetical protein